MINLNIYPKNKEHFKKLIPFAQKILSLCNNEGISPVIYGSFAHFAHTKDKNMNVNDIDFMVPKEELKKIERLLKRDKINFTRCSPNDYSMIAKKGKLIVELDELEGLHKPNYKNNFEECDFYGQRVKIYTIEQLEEIYITAFAEAVKTKEKVINRIKSLENFLGRKIKNPLSIDIINNKYLTTVLKKIINQARMNEWGKNETRDFNKDYEPNTKWFFIKDKGKIVSLGGLRPIKIKYLGKTYNILGICSIISLVKGKGYGKILISFMKSHSYVIAKTLLGFTTQTEFFKKAGLGTKKNFVRRFIYKNPKTKEEIIDNEGDGIYYEGKDKFITNVLSTKSKVYISIPHW